MTKLEFFISLAIGQISSAIAIISKKKQSEKRDKWIKALKAASAALGELLDDDETD